MINLVLILSSFNVLIMENVLKMDVNVISIGVDKTVVIIKELNVMDK